MSEPDHLSQAQASDAYFPGKRWPRPLHSITKAPRLLQVLGSSVQGTAVRLHGLFIWTSTLEAFVDPL